jgi:hypothetical protein
MNTSTSTITRRNEWLNKLSKINGTHLYGEIHKDPYGGLSSTDFYKFNGDRVKGPFNCGSYYTMNNEQYDKIIKLINHGTREEIRGYDEELVKLVKAGLEPGNPYIVLDGEGYVMVEKVFNEPEADSKSRAWGELSDEELMHWCEVLDNLNKASTNEKY